MIKYLITLAIIIAATSTAFAAGDDGKDFQPLFNGTDLTGWKPRMPTAKPGTNHPAGRNCWVVDPGGILRNNIQLDKPWHGQSVDLLTKRKFRNFVVRYEYMTPDRANSGFYLRGRQEIQILGDYKTGKATKGGNGAIYNFKAPDEFVTKPGGEWQTAEVTLIGDRITVILNGVKIHDNIQCDQPTGGQLDRNMDQPGPIMLQGDHGPVSFRNIRLKELPD